MLIRCSAHNGRLFSQVKGCTYDEAQTRGGIFSLKRAAFSSRLWIFFVLAVVVFFRKLRGASPLWWSCLWLGGMGFDNFENRLAQHYSTRAAAAAAAARRGLEISTRQFACLIKSRMVTSPRAWLFTVTPPTSTKKWWHSNLRGNSGAQHFSQRRWNLTVAFHGVTMQRWGVEDPERRQRGSISSILVAWGRLLSFDFLFQMSFQDRATNQLPTVVFNYGIILLLFINISSVFSSISQRSFSKK